MSLSWLVVSTCHYIKEYDWYINRDDGHCYGSLKKDGKEGLYKYDGVDDLEQFILMPELQDYIIEDAAEHLREWCSDNKISIKEDLDDYKSIERQYWGYDE